MVTIVIVGSGIFVAIVLTISEGGELEVSKKVGDRTMAETVELDKDE